MDFTLFYIKNHFPKKKNQNQKEPKKSQKSGKKEKYHQIRSNFRIPRVRPKNIPKNPTNNYKKKIQEMFLQKKAKSCFFFFRFVFSKHLEISSGFIW